MSECSKLAEIIGQYAVEHKMNIVDISLTFTYYLWQQGYLDRQNENSDGKVEFSSRLSYIA